MKDSLFQGTTIDINAAARGIPLFRLQTEQPAPKTFSVGRSTVEKQGHAKYVGGRACQLPLLWASTKQKYQHPESKQDRDPRDEKNTPFA